VRGAVDQVGGKTVQNRAITNVGDGLQGMIPNLNLTTSPADGGGGTPGAVKRINLRGYTGLGALSSPLILVDGVPASMDAVNPQDIENITVLKDAASSAIYGSRAPNGVVLITTKQGRKDQPLRISYNNNLSSSSPIHMLKTMNSLDWANLYNEAQKNYNGGQYIPDSMINKIKAYLADPVNTPQTFPSSDGVTWGNGFTGNANNDWFKIWLKNNSFSQTHNLSLDGGSGKIAYFLGLGYINKEGSYRYYNDSYERFNFRSNITADVNKWVSMALKTTFAQENYNYPYGGGGSSSNNWFHNIARIWPITPLIDPNGGYDPNSYIPILMEGGKNLTRNNDSWITGEINIKPLPGWTITGSYSYNYYTGAFNASVLPYHYSTQQNPFTLSTTTSTISKTRTNNNYRTFNVFTNYEKRIKDHYFKLMIGEQQEVKHSESLTGSNSNLYNIDQPSISLTYGTSTAASDGGYEWATMGTFGRINYSFNDKYLLEANGRYMGASLFPSATRWHLFTAFSAGWVVSKEAFWKSLENSVQFLKLRGSYGVLGDLSYFLDNGNYYPYASNLVTTAPTNTTWIFNTAGTRQPSASPPTQLISPTITWAKPAMLDFGADITFLKDFNLTFDWYKRKTTDLFGPAGSYPSILGISPPSPNNATTETKGYEISLAWNHRFEEVLVNVRATLSDYTGKIISYSGNSAGSLGSYTGFNNSTWYSGKVMGEIWGFKTEGLFQSQAEIDGTNQKALDANWYPGDVHYKDLNGDGKINMGSRTISDHGDLTVIGNSTPRYNYGFSAGVEWKGIDFNFFLQGIGKASFWSGENGNANINVANYFWGIARPAQSTALTTLYDRWTPDNPNGYFPRLYLENTGRNKYASDRYLINTSYLRVKNVQLGYTIPERITQKARLDRVRIYISGENLLTFSPAFKHQFVDPELLQSVQGSGNTTGDSKIYPLQRTFSVGFNINFQ
jgi:TonB-linked SusC/RagA family outer membrane protein